MYIYTYTHIHIYHRGHLRDELVVGGRCRRRRRALATLVLLLKEYNRGGDFACVLHRRIY